MTQVAQVPETRCFQLAVQVDRKEALAMVLAAVIGGVLLAIVLAYKFFGRHSKSDRARSSAQFAVEAPASQQGAPLPSSDSVTVRGPWMNALWSDVPVRLPRTVELPAFLEQDQMPVLPVVDPDWPGSTSASKDRHLHWMIALLHHPDQQVVLGTLRYWEANWSKHVASEVAMSYRALLFDSAADHLIASDEDLSRAAAGFMWRGYSESNFANLMSILADPAYSDRKKAMACLRRYCPAEHAAVPDGWQA